MHDKLRERYDFEAGGVVELLSRETLGFVSRRLVRARAKEKLASFGLDRAVTEFLRRFRPRPARTATLRE